MKEKVEKAREFALRAHADQKYGDKPYSYHLDMVAKFAEPYGENSTITAFLHDVAEDTSTTLDEIRQEFGDLIADACYYLTDCDGQNRKERKANTYLKVKEAISRGIDESLRLALVVKACDRLANLTNCVQTKNFGLLRMYKKEAEDFRNAYYHADICENLWQELDKLNQR